MKPRTALLTMAAMLVIAATATASILIITSSGYYTLSEDSSGVPVIQKVDQVIRLSGDPDDPTDPPPPTSTYAELQRVAAVESAKIDDNTTAKAISEIYKMVGDRVADGSIKPDDSFKAVSSATDAVLKVTGTADKWTAWRGAITNELVKLKQTGKLKTKADHVAALGAVRRGLESKGLFDNIDLEKLIELIKLIMSIIAMFGI